MENNDNDLFGGFSAIADTLTGYTEEDKHEFSDVPFGGDKLRKPPVKDEDEIEEEEEEIEEIEEEEIEEEEEEFEDDLSEEEIEAINSKKKKPAKQKNPRIESDDSDLGETEPEIAEYLQEKLFEEFNLEVDGETFKKFESIKDVTGFIKEAIEANSIPEFASDEVANIDQYVRKGGNLAEYMSNVYGDIDLEKIDLEKESNQKAIIRQDLVNQGMSEARINRRIERMEDTGILEEEAEDALESLKEFKQKQQQTLLQKQEKAAADAERDNLEFVKSVEAELDAMDSVRGIPLTKAEKNKLYNYMLRPTADGVPQYHIDYRKHRKNMIESAYFTMMGDKLVTKVEAKAKSTAAKKLKDKLADKGRRGNNLSTMGSDSMDSWSSIARVLR
jgi:hypothetical protein